MPCLFRVPGLLPQTPPQTPPQTIDTPVSLLDVVPTSLELLGFRAELPMDGVSLVPAMRGQKRGAERPIVLTRFAVGRMRPLDHAVVMGTHKGFFSRSGRGIGWYDLAADPAEKQRKPPDDPAMKLLGAALRAWRADLKGPSR